MEVILGQGCNNFLRHNTTPWPHKYHKKYIETNKISKVFTSESIQGNTKKKVKLIPWCCPDTQYAFVWLIIPAQAICLPERRGNINTLTGEEKGSEDLGQWISIWIWRGNINTLAGEGKRLRMDVVWLWFSQCFWMFLVVLNRTCSWDHHPKLIFECQRKLWIFSWDFHLICWLTDLISGLSSHNMGNGGRDI